MNGSDDPTDSVKAFICVCTALCTIVAHNIPQNRPDNFPSYPPGNYHCSDDVYMYLREEGSEGQGRGSKFNVTGERRAQQQCLDERSWRRSCRQNSIYRVQSK